MGIAAGAHFLDVNKGLNRAGPPPSYVRGWPESADLLQRGPEGVKPLGRLVHKQEVSYAYIATAKSFQYPNVCHMYKLPS